MQSRNTISLVTSLLLTAAACAHQNAGTGMDDQEDPMADEGTTTGGTSSKAGTSSLPHSGTTSVSTAGKTSSSGGTGADLPPIGSAGKTSGGSGGKGSGGKAGTGGTMEAAGGEDTGPVNMPIVGLSVTFAAASTSDPNDFLGGELAVINDTAQPLSLADVKVRYYFSNEITAVMPSVMMNWAQFGPKSNLGGATCTGTINKAATPKPGADSYVELTCSGASGTELTAGTLLKISWKAGAQGMGKFIQSDDWSFTDPTKIVVMNGQTIVWGVAP
jgi:Cellulose binding domain